MLTVLHLHDDALATICLTEYIVDQRSVVSVLRRLLLVEKFQVCDHPFTFEQVVEEIKQQWLGELLSEDPLEADIGKWIDKSAHTRPSI